MDLLKKYRFTALGATLGLLLHYLFYRWAENNAQSYIPMIVEFILTAPVNFLVALVFNGRQVSMEQVGYLTLVGASITSSSFGGLVGYQFDSFSQPEKKQKGSPIILAKLLLSATAAFYFRPSIRPAPYRIALFEHHFVPRLALFVVSYCILSAVFWGLQNGWQRMKGRATSS